MSKFVVLALVLIGLYLLLRYSAGTSALLGGASKFATSETTALQGR